MEDATAVLLVLEAPAPGCELRCDDQVVGYGWALAATPVLSVVVALDGLRVCEASIGLVRDDIAELYPDRAGGGRCGFAFLFRIPEHAGGPAEVAVTARTADGETTTTVPVDIIAAAALAPRVALGLPDLPPIEPPPAEIRAPIRLELEDARIDADGGLHVRGWALGVRAIQTVQAFVAGRSLGFAETGQARGDVAEAFPDDPNAAAAGFALTLPAPPDATDGLDLTVIATDIDGETQMASRPLVAAPREAATPPAAPQPMHLALEECSVNEFNVLRVRGWVVSLSAIERVRVYLDDSLFGTADVNLPRGDVGHAYPDYPDAGHAGFLLQREVNDDSFAGRAVRVVASALGGIRRERAATVVVAPPTQRDDRDTADIQCRCDAVSLSETGGLALKGWAICPTGLEAVDVELGDEMLGTAILGEDRADVASQFPHVTGARTAGFRFLGRAAAGRAGEQVVRLTVRGHGGETRVLLQPVLARPGEPTVDDAEGSIRFYLDSPVVKDGRAVEAAHGFLSIHGWAFSAAGVDGIEVFIDGRSQGQAYRGIRREDLLGSFAAKEALRSGFAMLVPPQVLKPGRHAVRVMIRDGAGHVEEVAFAVDAEPSMERPGPWWLREKVTQAEADLLLAVLAAAAFRPAWTVVMPVAGMAPRKRILATLESLRTQAYPDWHLVVPVATERARRDLLEALAEDLGTDPSGMDGAAARLRVVTAPAETAFADLVPPGTQPALVTLLAPGDLLGEDALLEFAIAAAEAGRPDFLYSDERRIDPADGMTRAFFKPDWSPDLLLSTNYIGRLWAATPDLLGRAGVVLGDVERHGEYDLALRLTEQAHSICHVAKVLCARGAKLLDPQAVERRALQRALSRRAIEAEVLPGCLPGTWRVKRHVARAPLVSIVIPTIAERGLIRAAIASIRQFSASNAIEIVCLDNIDATATLDGAGSKAWLREAADVVVDIPGPFNWSRFNNFGARAARGDVLLFLNDDIEITQVGWLDGLLEQALRPEVGAVGPQLLYPEGKVQHAGMFLARSVGRHAFRFSRHDEPGPFGLALTLRNVIAVTGACLMVRREVFEELGGFDEAHAVINNDLDFCLRLRASGRSVVYTPHVSLIHHEMVSRGGHADDYDVPLFDSAWKDLFLGGDPFFNPNLSIDFDDYAPDEEAVRILPVGHPVIARELVRRVLAIKVDHLGDFITAFPAFRRLKERFPQAELTVLAAPGSVPLAALEPAIDRVIAFEFFHPRSERGRKPIGKKELARLEETLIPHRFDLAMDLRRQPETRELLRHTGARWLAGFDQRNQTRWLDIAVEWEGDVARTPKRTHIGDALVQFVEAVAVACETDRRGVRAAGSSGAARAALAALAPVAGFAARLGTRPLICVHVGAGAENKQWPVPSFAGLIDLLMGRHDAAVAVIGGAEEAEVVEDLMSKLRDPSRVLALAGRLGLRELPSLLLACDLYVGNDSGPKHLAAALGVPTVGIHSGSVDATEWGPMGTVAVGIRRAMTCSPCYLARASDCHRGLACLTGIRVADVYRACQRMLALGRPALAASAFAPRDAAT